MNSDSKRPSSAARSGPPAPRRDVCRVPSGSAATLALRADAHRTDAPGLALLLAGRRLTLRSARAAATRLFDTGFAVVTLPAPDDLDGLRRDLADLGVDAVPYGPPGRVDVKRLREEQGLTQEEFATEFGLDLSTLRNWEQGRSEPDTATRTLLRTIASHPAAVHEALRGRE